MNNQKKQNQNTKIRKIQENPTPSQRKATKNSNSQKLAYTIPNTTKFRPKSATHHNSPKSTKLPKFPKMPNSKSEQARKQNQNTKIRKA